MQSIDSDRELGDVPQPQIPRDTVKAASIARTAEDLYADEPNRQAELAAELGYSDAHAASTRAVYSTAAAIRLMAPANVSAASAPVR